MLQLLVFQEIIYIYLNVGLMIIECRVYVRLRKSQFLVSVVARLCCFMLIWGLLHSVLECLEMPPVLGRRIE